MKTSSGETNMSSTNLSSRIAGETLGSVSELARETGERAKRGALDAASGVTDQVKDLLDRQLSGGVHFAAQLAHSVRKSTTEFQESSPLLAGAVEILIDKVEAYTEDMEDRTVDHVLRTASDLTRRQPAVVFGLAALAGFFVYRAVKATAPIEAPPPNRPDVGASAGNNRHEG